MKLCRIISAIHDGPAPRIPATFLSQSTLVNLGTLGTPRDPSPASASTTSPPPTPRTARTSAPRSLVLHRCRRQRAPPENAPRQLFANLVPPRTRRSTGTTSRTRTRRRRRRIRRRTCVHDGTCPRTTRRRRASARREAAGSANASWHRARGDVGGNAHSANVTPRRYHAVPDARAFVGAEQGGQSGTRSRWRSGLTSLAHSRSQHATVKGTSASRCRRRATGAGVSSRSALADPDGQKAGTRVPPGAEQIRRPDASRIARRRLSYDAASNPGAFRGAGEDALALSPHALGCGGGDASAGWAPRRRCDVVHLADETKALPRRVRGPRPLPRHRPVLLVVVVRRFGWLGAQRARSR